MIKDFLIQRFNTSYDMLMSAKEDAEYEQPYVSEDTKFQIETYTEDTNIIAHIIRTLFPDLVLEDMENFTTVPSQEQIENLLLTEIDLFGIDEEDYDSLYDDVDSDDTDEDNSYVHYKPEEIRDICLKILIEFNDEYSTEGYLEEKLGIYENNKTAYLPEIDSLEEQIVELLIPTGTDEVVFSEEENIRLRDIYKEKDAENHSVEVHDFIVFSVYTYLGRGCIVVDDTIDCDMAYFSMEFKQELLNILKTKSH